MYPIYLCEHARFGELRSGKDPSPPGDQSPHEATIPLTRRAALTALLALSLGLWAAIWAALASLASAALG